MKTIISRIEQLTHERTGTAIPASKITIPLEPDTTSLGEAQKKADKLKVTLLEVQELIRKPTIEYEITAGVRSFTETADLVEKIYARHSKDANLKIIVKAT